MQSTLSRVLSADEVNEAKDMAIVTSAKYEGRTGHYTNDFNRHFKGKLGELALEQELLSRGVSVDPFFRSPIMESSCDIFIASDPPKRIEVKSWSEEHWPHLGRCVSVQQAFSIKKKADLIAWCVVHLKKIKEPSSVEARTVTVDFMGWSRVVDLDLLKPLYTGAPFAKPVLNYQFPNESITPFPNFFSTTPCEPKSKD